MRLVTDLYDSSLFSPGSQYHRTIVTF